MQFLDTLSLANTQTFRPKHHPLGTWELVRPPHANHRGLLIACRRSSCTALKGTDPAYRNRCCCSCSCSAPCISPPPQPPVVPRHMFRNWRECSKFQHKTGLSNRASGHTHTHTHIYTNRYTHSPVAGRIEGIFGSRRGEKGVLFLATVGPASDDEVWPALHST